MFKKRCNEWLMLRPGLAGARKHRAFSCPRRSHTLNREQHTSSRNPNGCLGKGCPLMRHHWWPLMLNREKEETGRASPTGLAPRARLRPRGEPVTVSSARTGSSWLWGADAPPGPSRPAALPPLPPGPQCFLHPPSHHAHVLTYPQASVSSVLSVSGGVGCVSSLSPPLCRQPLLLHPPGLLSELAQKTCKEAVTASTGADPTHVVALI